MRNNKGTNNAKQHKIRERGAKKESTSFKPCTNKRTKREGEKRRYAHAKRRAANFEKKFAVFDLSKIENFQITNNKPRLSPTDDSESK
jgi:hypothetical protein